MLGSRVTAYSSTAQHALESARQGFLASGADPVTASQRAHAAIFGIVQRQAAMVSFVDMFRLLGMIFLLLVPLVLLMRRPRRTAPVTAH